MAAKKPNPFAKGKMAPPFGKKADTKDDKAMMAAAMKKAKKK